MSRSRALMVLAVFLVSLIPGRAGATPVCTDGYMGGPPLELCGGRVFPEAANTVDYVQYLPDPATGFSEYMHGMEYLAQLYPRWISVFTLRDHFEDDPAVSVGPDGRRSTADDDSGDGHDILVIKITDHEVPDEGKETLLYSLSIHGDEKGGIEGGVRAAEDLAIAATEGGTIADGVGGYESTTGRQPDIRSYPVADVLANEVVYLVDFNIDGWRRGDHFAPTPGLYTRGNQLGVDLNRQMPTVGYINPSRNPLQESEMFYGHRFMHEVAEAGVGGRMAYGADVHGEGQSRAWADIMYPAGQFDSVKHRRLMSIAERTKSVIDDTLFFGIPNQIEEATGGDAGEGLEDFGAPKNTIPTKPARWGTVWDTLGYTDTGFLGDYMAAELGVTGMDYEIALNHSDTRAYGRPWGVLLQENYINTTRAIIKTAMAYAMAEREDFADFEIAPGGRVGYVFNPDTVTDTDEDGSGRLPGPQANGIGQDGRPIEQRPYEATNMQFFEDENDFVVGGFNKALSADIASDPSYLDQFDSLVLADIALPEDAAGRPVDAAAYYENLRAWVERGGNLVLTDRALHALTEMSVLEAGSVTDVNVYQPYSNIVDLEHHMVEGLRSNARQLSEATLIGYGIGNNASPMTVVDRAQWEAAGGHTVGTTGNNTGSSDPETQTSAGELSLGEGFVRILGGGLHMPTEQNDHRYGLKDYSLTYSGLFIIENSIVHDHPDLGELSEAVPTTIELDGPGSGQYTDEVPISATLTTTDGSPIGDSLITFELWNDSARESWTGSTDQNGRVMVPARLLVEPGQYMLTARYQGAADEFEPAADVQSFVVEKEDTALSLTVDRSGSQTTLTAVITDGDDPSAGVPGLPISLFANGESLGTVVTDGDGRATTEVPNRYRKRNTEFEAAFDGAEDTFWRSSNATTRW